MDERTKVTPCTCFSHDDKGGRLNIEVQLPGVDKKDILLEMRKDSFCVTALRGKDTEYSGCFMLAHEIESGKAQAKFDNGLLKIFAPIKDWDKRTHIMVQ
ncbi:MAG: Hsp20/alpha crystallin family protein [Thermodesulfobacteriota bacterium]|jgi:HSP20 family protein